MPEAARVEKALAVLKDRGQAGIPRAEFRSLFGSDREGRAVMAHIREHGLAPVVVARARGREVYRLAQSEAEYRAYRRSQVKRIRSLVKSIQGLDRAWARSAKTTPQQIALFDSLEEEAPYAPPPF